MIAGHNLIPVFVSCKLHDDLAFVNYPLLKKRKKKHNPNFFEGGITLTQRSLTFRGSLEFGWELCIPIRTVTRSSE